MTILRLHLVGSESVFDIPVSQNTVEECAAWVFDMKQQGVKYSVVKGETKNGTVMSVVEWDKVDFCVVLGTTEQKLSLPEKP